MKLLIVLISLVAVCSGNAIPVVPGDNSHYIEGESRYIWMPDGKGKPHLVDLQAPVDKKFLSSRNGAKNEYWLFTRRNPLTAQVITHGDEDSIWNSHYVATNPLMVVVHGWNSNGKSDMNPLITAAYLEVEDANVIVVDWSSVAGGFYTTAVHSVPSVGQYLGNFLIWLIETAGGDWNNVHITGHSLGAHVAGNAGRTTGGLPKRITGMDPAGPQWGGNSNALNIDDGQYVETVNTDGGVLGIFTPIGLASFYPNGGRNPQPGCWISTCSHSRAPKLFASSVRNNHLVGRLCADIDEADDGKCTGEEYEMGNSNLNKTGSGIYGLTTESSWPF